MKASIDIEVGKLVQVWHGEKKIEAGVGIVTKIREERELFSEKYAIMENVTYVEVLIDEQIETFCRDEYNFEVINEN